MSTKHYCAFWYPSILHKTDVIVAERKFKIDNIEISDNVKSSFRLFLSIKESEQGHLDFTTYTYGLDGVTRIPQKSLTLTLEKKSNNGFIIYSYTDDSIDFREYIYSSTFYHHAKSLRHSHEINHDSDSGLEALSDSHIAFTPDDIFTPNNVILQYYIGQYEKLFAEHYANYLSDQNAFYDRLVTILNLLNDQQKINSLNTDEQNSVIDAINVIIKKIDEIEPILGIGHVSNISQFNRAAKRLRKRGGRLCNYFVQNNLRICNNAEIEYTYCKTLLESKYNTEIKHNIRFTPEELGTINKGFDVDLLRRDKSRKIANNIRNSMRYIECIRDKCNDFKYELVDAVLDSSEKLSQRAYWLAWFFGIATVISLVFSVVSLFM